ncbi:MAG: hypothetical protein U0234_20440 [Sandaracinus sp.]
MSSSDETGEPRTETMPALEGATVAGAAATLELHHLHGLLTVLGPLRAAYTGAAIDRLRGMPADARRAVLPHLFEEHPELAHDPRMRALAGDAAPPSSAPSEALEAWMSRLTGASPGAGRDVLERVEQVLRALARSVAHATLARRGAIRALGGFAPDRDVRTEEIPDEARALLRWLLESGEGTSDRPRVLERAAGEWAAHLVACEAASADAAEALFASLDPRAPTGSASPRWWPSAFRDAATLRALAARAAEVGDVRAHFRDLYARAYFARRAEET